MKPRRVTSKREREAERATFAKNSESVYELDPKLAHCKRCGSEHVTWMESKRTGKFYLTEVFQNANNRLYTSKTEFHSTYCGDMDLHDAEQRRILNPVELDEDDD